MRRVPLIAWVLGGALLASAGLNLGLLAGGGAGPAPSRREGPGPVPSRREAPGRCSNATLSRLGLTDQQCARLKRCCHACVSDRTSLEQVVKSRCEELDRLLNTPGGFDEERACALAEEIGRARTQLLKSRIHSISLVRKTLTARQLEVLAEEGGR